MWVEVRYWGVLDVDHVDDGGQALQGIYYIILL